MNFIVKSIGKSFHKWNFQEVDTKLNSSIYMNLIPWADSRFDLGKDYVLCSDDYYDKQRTANERDETFLNKKIISEASISIFNFDECDEEHKKKYSNNCGKLIHDEHFVGIEIAVRNDTFKEIQNNILLNKPIVNFSLDFKNHYEKDDVSYGSDWNGSHQIWTKDNEENKLLDVEDYNIAFRFYDLPESLSYEEKESAEIDKQTTLMNTITHAILEAHRQTRMDQGARFFNELKPYLIGIIILLTIIAAKLSF